MRRPTLPPFIVSHSVAVSRALGGGIVTLAWLAVFGVQALAGGRFVADALSQIVVFLTPGPIFTVVVRTFRHLAERMLLAFSLGVLIGGGAVAGVVHRPTRDAWVVGVLAACISWGIGITLLVVGSDATAAAAVIDATVPALGAGFTAWSLKVPSRVRTAGRRRALRLVGSSVLGASAAGYVLKKLVVTRGRSRSGSTLPGTEERHDGEANRTVTPGPGGTSTPSETESPETEGRRRSPRVDSLTLDGLPPRVTRLEDFFTVDIAVTDPVVRADDWTLTVDGNAVEAPLEIGYDELVDRATTTQTVTVECISNEVGGGLISTGRFRGVPLRDLLEEAGIDWNAAVSVYTRAVDDYYEALFVEKARREEVLVCVGIDGVALPQERGFPCRLLVPGRYGMKSIKWLTDIEVRDHFTYGFWGDRNWDQEGTVKTGSTISTIQRAGDDLAAGGIAYAGDRGIRTVEASMDGGETWQVARIETPISPHSWVRWATRWKAPQRRDRTFVVRAVDGTGSVQTSRRTPALPDGATGWHRVTKTV